jgi:hypothetical protein
VPHTIEKLSTRDTTLLQTSFQLEVFTQSYGHPKWRETHLGVLRQNDIWVLAPWPGTKNTIRVKVVASPKSGPWWVLWVHVCLWFVYAPNCFNYTPTNLLFGLCRFVWVIDLLVNLPSPNLGAPTCPSTPEVLRVRERARIPSPSIVFTFGLIVESIKELGGVSILHSKHP